MEENKKGTNVSSGAQKVEKIEQATRASGAPVSGKKAGKKPTAKKQTALARAKKSADASEKKEQASAQKRVKEAKAQAKKKQEKLALKAELRQKKLEKKSALKEKKLARQTALKKKREEIRAKQAEKRAQLKAKRAEKRAERLARREALAHESATQKKRRIEREKKEKLALRRQKQEAEQKAREEKRKAQEARRKASSKRREEARKERRERRSRDKSSSGWLAAVISLGVVALALSTVVTAGAFRMNDMNMASANGFRSTLYEMVSASEDMDGSFSKLRVSEGVNEQRALLTNILVDTVLLESAVERCPVEDATAMDISSFVNHTNSFARMMLQKLARGERLSEREREILDRLYQTNRGLFQELTALSMNMTEYDLGNFLSGEECEMKEKFNQLGTNLKPEAKATAEAPFTGAGNVKENQLSKYQEIDLARAEALCKEYFGGYHVTSITYTGETLGRGIACYNFSLKSENDVEIFAQITKRGGKLAFFERYEPCAHKNFDLEACDDLAEKFLEKLGIDDMEAVWLSETGVTADITYVCEHGDARVYSDMIKVRVCESKGMVVGMDASAYWMNHTERTFSPALSKAQVQSKVSKRLNVKNSELALVPIDGREVLCYEFNGTYGDEEYIVYLDANTGEEVQVYLVRSGEQGRYLR